MAMESPREPKTVEAIAEELWTSLKERERGTYDPELNEHIGLVVDEFVATGHLPPSGASEKERPEAVYPLDDDRAIRFLQLGSEGWIAQALTSDHLKEQEAREVQEDHVQRALERRRLEAAGSDDPLERAQRAIERIDKIEF